jgi:hypothetical protein
MPVKRSAYLLLALAAGCSFESDAPLETAPNTCADDVGCVQGQCAGEICIDDTGSSVEVAVEVLSDPSDARSLAPASWAFTAESFSGASVRDWMLPETREVRGTVRWDGVPVPATLRFIRRMPSAVEPLKPVPIEVDTFRNTTGASEAQSFDYSAVLVAGETYDVVVLPTSDLVTSPRNATAPAVRSLPPLYLETVVDAGAADEPFRVDIEFPAELTSQCTSANDSGCTLQGGILGFDGEMDTAVAGLQVQAIDELTGLFVSSVGETTELGRFAIRIGPGVSDYFVRVTSSVGRDPFPAVSVDPQVLFDDNPARVVRVPRLDSVQYTGGVRDQEGSAVAGATVRFLSTGIFDGSELGLVGSFTGSATTNEDGSFGAKLLPGLYSITVTPPEDTDSAWGVLSTEAFVVDDLSPTEPLVLPSRVQLSGEVTTFADEPAAGITVLARARQSEETDTMNRSREVVSGREGTFKMQMDRGLYDIHVKVPAESGYAWLVEPALAMNDDLVRRYRLVPPVPIQGALLSSGGAPVPGAQLRAYRFVDDGTTRRLLQVAETTTDEEGNYRLLIAPRLDGE